MRDLYVKNGHGFVLAYSITSQATFHDLDEFYERIVRIKDVEVHVSVERRCIPVDENEFFQGPPPLVLVGNKSDLEDERVVGRQLGQELARRWKCTFLETSAKNELNVNEVNSLPIITCNRKRDKFFVDLDLLRSRPTDQSFST